VDRVARLNALLKTAGSRHGATEPEAAEFVQIADQLRIVFESVAVSDLDGAARRVNQLLLVTGARPALERHDGEPWHVHFHSRDDDFADGWAGPFATALATVLGSEYADRLGVCSAPECDRVYVDVSRNGTRRFCSTACQNRVKAAAHRARAGSLAGG